jgi:hypothetical protein
LAFLPSKESIAGPRINLSSPGFVFSWVASGGLIFVSPDPDVEEIVVGGPTENRLTVSFISVFLS